MSEPHVEVTPQLIERYFSLTATAREKATPLHNPESAEGVRLSTMMEMADSYTSDAKWFVEQGDLVRAFGAINEHRQIGVIAHGGDQHQIGSVRILDTHVKVVGDFTSVLQNVLSTCRRNSARKAKSHRFYQRRQPVSQQVGGQTSRVIPEGSK